MYNKRVDIHSLIMPGEIPPFYTRPCPGIENNILQARMNAFMSSTVEYVSFIDSGDEILVPNIFDLAVDYLDKNPVNGVYTNSLLNNSPLLEDHEWSPEYHSRVQLPIHQLVIIRKDAIVNAILDLEIHSNFMPEQLLYAHIKPWKFMNINAYRWNRKNGVSTNPVSQQEQERVHNYITSHMCDKY